ncbi:hypothetical protein VTO42DRAFT_280 [Malbranchea cinnamomea]
MVSSIATTQPESHTLQHHDAGCLSFHVDVFLFTLLSCSRTSKPQTSGTQLRSDPLTAAAKRPLLSR